MEHDPSDTVQSALQQGGRAQQAMGLLHAADAGAETLQRPGSWRWLQWLHLSPAAGRSNAAKAAAALLIAFPLGCKCRVVGAAEVVIRVAGAARDQLTAMSATAGAELQSPKQLPSQAERLQQARQLRGSPSRARQELSQQSLMQLQELELQLQAHSPGHTRSPAGRGASAGDSFGLCSCVICNC